MERDCIEDEERQPLNAMVAENLKNVIIKKIYRDSVDKSAPASNDGFSPLFRQYLLGFGTAFVGLSSGMTAGYSAILLPQLYSDDADFYITEGEGTWIASMAALPMMLGCLFSGYPMDRFGRKNSMFASSLLFSIGWAVLALATDVIGLYVGRFLTGFSVGLVAPICQVYIAESSNPKHRGILLSTAPLSVAIGILISHVLGTFLHWKPTAGLCGVPPLIGLAVLFMIPESPIWLLGHRTMDAAEKSYKWFHGTSDKVTQEWANIVAKSKEVECNDSEISKMALMKRSSFLKPLFVLMAFFFVQQFSGVNAVSFYCVTIVKDIIPNINEYLATIVIDIVRFVISVVGVLLLRRYGRKTLAIVSGIGTAMCLFALSIYLTVTSTNLPIPIVANATNETKLEVAKEVEAVFSAVHCIPLICLVGYICFVSIGLVPLPWVLTGELFSKELRGVGSGVTSSFGFICYFLVVKTTQTMFHSLGRAGTFSFFGGCCLLGVVVLSLYLPETKDKTLLEIEAFYDKKAKTKDEECVVTRF